jgi:hypothetical protein
MGKLSIRDLESRVETDKVLSPKSFWRWRPPMQKTIIGGGRDSVTAVKQFGLAGEDDFYFDGRRRATPGALCTQQTWDRRPL